jgi:hypothetical protein
MRRLLRTSSFNVAKPQGNAQGRCGSRSSVAHIRREIMILALPCGGMDRCGERRRNPICSDDGVADGRAAGLDQGKFDGRTMKGDQDRATEKIVADVKDSRRDRLKLALRENLKRRKSQARGRGEASASSESADASLDTAGGEKP